MVKYTVLTKDTRVYDVDYLIEDPDKLLKIIPYMQKKIEGDWEVALMEPPIQFVRDVTDTSIIPDYITLTLYMEKSVSNQLMSERPKLLIKEKSAYERYIDLIGDMKVDIDPKAAKELYRRVGVSKTKIPDYLAALSESGNTITVQDVRREVTDERKVYASDVINSFIIKDKYRWKKYNELVSVLGRKYAFFAMRKYVNKLIVDKDKYLRNMDTEIFNIDRIDSMGVCLAYTIFNTVSDKELDLCMLMLERRELLKKIM